MLLKHISFLISCSILAVVNAQESALEQNPAPSRQANVNLNDPVVCDCGFIDESNNVWSDIWHANYGLYKSSLQYDRHYLVMDYTVNAKHKNTLNRIFSPSNVKLHSTNGISLAVRKNSDGKYTSAAVGTKRSDFLYGTYRARLKTSNIPGTVAAFFFYRNDTSEIDMESLSRNQDPYKTYFAIQPQLYEKDGSASSLTHEKHNLPFNPTDDFHEYRFDWLPGSVKFYIDDTFVREMTTNVPNAPGRVLINHWTDGNPFFSGGPPEQDSELKVSHLNIFFNSSEATGPPTCQKSKTPCKVSDIMSRNLLPLTEVVSGASRPSQNTLMAFLCLLVLLLHLEL